jgi:hypothetical protein
VDSVSRKQPTGFNAGSGSTCEMDRITTVFKADGDETGNQASI